MEKKKAFQPHAIHEDATDTAYMHMKHKHPQTRAHAEAVCPAKR